ncbi:Rsd/AlgQ family anti-sigma factor [Alteromonas pelagimontana]|uniref:Rsd/AlgQ family anti-sigma factor n=1 Tax=Alteromonas pelagimontana TaxID=1858656 RepID=A0A6M4MFH6_9ALTE|nr:Rsd/AlgQ family anti-sigma factor [Alteromonas pelagimontana]QJR81375.1 Rsd/AlgQ family anti-sigma factor [Alteromonas pelagimontana]
MLNQLEKVINRWGGRSATIDNWLQARQNLLIKYCQLAGLNVPTNLALPEANKISEFCNDLMDYLSAGHFEVYEMLVSDDESGSALKKRIYPKLAETTDRALSFSDKNAEAVTPKQASEFDADLTKLGETLEERFLLEDELINHMYHTESLTLSARQTVE